MNFRPELAEKVMRGEKTVTRRLVSDNPRSPWYRERCSLQVGRRYAVCPGRGKPANVQRLALGHLSDDEARREGFASAEEFAEAFASINGSYDPAAVVWRIEVAPVQIEAGR